MLGAILASALSNPAIEDGHLQLQLFGDGSEAAVAAFSHFRMEIFLATYLDPHEQFLVATAPKRV